MDRRDRHDFTDFLDWCDAAFYAKYEHDYQSDTIFARDGAGKLMGSWMGKSGWLMLAPPAAAAAR